jgi:hypothetical protein
MNPQNMLREKKAKQKMSFIERFHLHQLLGKGKSIETEYRLALTTGGGERESREKLLSEELE